jgi:uncharacterized membrane protein YbaN (DUF454 family)
VLLGACCVGLGALGVVVPGLPTTVFLLAASYLFARSSPRLERRLVEHPRLGRYLRLARERAMPLRVKLVAIAAMWGGIGASCIALAGHGPFAPIALVALGVIGTGVVLLRVRTLEARAPNA